MDKQKIVTAIAILGTVVAFISRNSVNLGLCEKPQIDCRTVYDTAEHIFYFFPVLLFFVTITVLASAVWIYWWAFAKYAAPICFALIVAINFGILHTGTTGSFGLGDMLNQTYDLWSLSLIYTVFTVGSLVQIFRGYRAGRRGVIV